MKKILIFALLVTAIVTGCSKNKCESCETTNSTYLDDVLISKTTGKVECGATPGTTSKRAPGPNGRQYLIVTTTKCD